jgi:quinol-cytochrome oxidoreductase complex cytochrome b subunit
MLNSINIFLNMKRLNNSYLFAFVSNHLIYYPTPISLTYAWSFGFLAGMCLVTQMISGIFLAMHYTPHVDLAFSSVEYIMRDVPNVGSFGMFMLMELLCSS